MSLALDGSATANGSGTTLGITLTTANAGDIIIIAATINGTTIASISGGGLTWALRGRSAGGIETWWAVAPSALSAVTFTVHHAGTATYCTLHAFGVSGANTSAPFDGSPVIVTSTAAVISTTAPDTFIMGAYRYTGSGTPSVGAGFTLIQGFGFTMTEYHVYAAPQTSLTVPVNAGDGAFGGGIADALVVLAPPSSSPAAGMLFG